MTFEMTIKPIFRKCDQPTGRWTWRHLGLRPRDLKSASYNWMGFFSPWALEVYFLKIKITNWNVNVMDCLNNLPNEKMTNPLTNQWTNQLTNQPTNQPIYQLTNRLTDSPINRLTNQLICGWLDKHIDKQRDQQMDWPIDGRVQEQTYRQTDI